METDLRFTVLPQAVRHVARCLAQAPVVVLRAASHTQGLTTYVDTPDGHVPPWCTATFERTRWLIGLQSSQIAVTLDVGELQADDLRAPMCELRLELQSGAPEAVFGLAQLLSQRLSLLPLHTSKRQRARQLVQHTLHAPRRAAPVALTPPMPLLQVAGATLQEMYLQFVTNLVNLRESDEPEVLHQARIGWRRFKSALQLFKKHPDMPLQPARAPLQALCSAMTALRDLDVALAQTLPMFAHAYTDGDPLRRQQWQTMEQALCAAAAKQRGVLLAALEEPAVGTQLIEWAHWLARQFPLEPASAGTHAPPVDAWLRARLLRMHRQLVQEPANANDPVVQHRIRILSKRLRYCVEALRPLLPKGRSKRWLQTAVALQENIGAVRDIACAVEIVDRLQADAGIVQFLRGVAVGQRMHTR